MPPLDRSRTGLCAGRLGTRWAVGRRPPGRHVQMLTAARQTSPDGLVARALIRSVPGPFASRRSTRNDPLGARVIALRDTATLEVTDDGRGFTVERRERRAAGGHMGLTLLEDVAAQAGGSLDARSAPGGGTTVRLELGPR